MIIKILSDGKLVERGYVRFKDGKVDLYVEDDDYDGFRNVLGKTRETGSTIWRLLSKMTFMSSYAVVLTREDIDSDWLEKTKEGREATTKYPQMLYTIDGIWL